LGREKKRAEKEPKEHSIWTKEDEWILWQAPWAIRRWDLMMHFQSQEADEWEGGREKS
jgi:hypothetical protein